MDACQCDTNDMRRGQKKKKSVTKVICCYKNVLRCFEGRREKRLVTLHLALWDMVSSTSPPSST